MFDKILIANRGEIACRVIRTAKRLGIRTVAVYSEADAESRHVAMADEAFLIGPPPAAESYLRPDAILDAAIRSGAQAVHPGYGFLSENAGFAEACAKAGITFIGPPVGAIRAMGSKSESKRLMEAAGVPLVPGYHGTGQGVAELTLEAARIGYPVLVKASAGGGGKGMRVVAEEAGLADAISSAKREAKAAFGDDSLLLERYLGRPRHVEIQVFADTQGNAVYLFERDCSIQRRHQKVIEEAPAPALDEHIRRAMGEAAVAAARAVDYVGAGTVEFLYQDGRFFFIEMNTRLQVEHPVTEMITGLDLVEWQLLVASGRPLPLAQDQITRHGHAFEARLYAEDPAKDFLPAIGRLVHLEPPAENRHVRVDTGVRSGDEVTMFYDPMIAKLIVWDVDRDAALRRLRRALADYHVAGVTTNVGFLGAIAAHPAFAAQEIDTGFIERYRADLLPAAARVPDLGLAFAALALLLWRDEEGREAARRSGDPFSPWHQTNGWRLNDDNHHDFRFLDGDESCPVTVHFAKAGWQLDLPGGSLSARRATLAGRTLTAEIGGERRSATVVRAGFDITVLHDGQTWRIKLDDPSAKAADRDAGDGRLAAPMPGTVVQVLVKPGDVVTGGQPLIVVEAMKMEHTIKAPGDGAVTAVHYGVGDAVAEGADLLDFEASAP
ncbi:3-methylcrotonyl-CoA carboxylase [Paramagnetospirillum marisnigri]|uniref:3-methylcrotonyl-CoA carboxylase n=1 Tax=Paramagnetospirillum marisnigri TaxID=1285242 RepID=A0A178MS66_9PROT|nr:acetyl/propionyl/methylcrotonyl-CoA carboxylase subunit alpha [Paramagnetospirillum marisnigri]OAN52220.1 3-methylcrotonyl-CoA carboxylase [Paramagnetospirillum marisnigri]